MNTIKLSAGIALAGAAIYLERPAAMAQESAGGRPQQQAMQPSGQINPAVFPSLQARTQNGVTYLCGGIGQEELSEMKRQAPAYDLMLSFAAHDGSYLADIGIEIKNKTGETVLQTRCDGPILLADLPRSGIYHVRAEADHQAVDRTVRVNESRRGKARVATAAVMVWPKPAEEAAVAPSGHTSSGR